MLGASSSSNIYLIVDIVFLLCSASMVIGWVAIAALADQVSLDAF